MKSNDYLIHRIFTLAIAIAFGLTGCSDKRTTVPEQIAFINKISAYKTQSDHLSYMKWHGKDENRELPPENLTDQIEDSDRKILQLLNKPPNAVQWIATVVSIRRQNNEIFISAGYRDQSYGLIIFDEKAKRIAEKFKEDDEISFTGIIFPEKSWTIFGALINAEFLIEPTQISSKYGQITQSPQDVSRRHLFDPWFR